MSMSYPFTTTESPQLGEVGGKALSLIRMTQAGLPVPPGIVLTLEFFLPWLERVVAMPDWARLLSSPPEDPYRACEAVKASALRLDMDDAQRAVLTQALAELAAGDAGGPFAVRSSSPEEDLEELSFAGGYETVLGVKVEDIEAAVRRSFVSCLDERVIVYKREHGLEVSRPRIAVIIQQQIASDAAGVAFSLNPLNNCYDEAVINANYGLGESVVSGAVSPDSWVFDKVTRSILDRKTGKKETSVWLNPDGGTSRKPSSEREQLCLTDEQILALTDMVARVEAYFGKPIDIEWAFADRQLYLLQARPITAYVPLPPSLLTPPGAPKRLYWDMSLSKWGMPEPLSVMGSDLIDIGNVAMLRMTMGNVSPEVVRQIRPVPQGRAYVNTSMSLKMQGRKRLAGEFRTMDALSAEVIESLHEGEYVPQKLPSELKGIIFKMIRQNLGLVGQLLQAIRRPEASKERYLETVRRLPDELASMVRHTSSIRELAERLTAKMVGDAAQFLSVIFAAELAKSRISRLFQHDPPEVRERVARLERALPHNVTIEMGLAMDRLARLEEISECASGDVFAAKLEARALSPEFLLAWDSFMEEFGFRCPMEMDPATPRPYERPAQFFEQLRAMALKTAEGHDPQALHEQVRAEREQAYAELLDIAHKKGKRKARRFEKDYRTLVALGGLRETPKYCAILVADMVRRRALETARTLVDAGRLDDTHQVFDLTFGDLDKAMADPKLDLRALAKDNTRFLRKLKHVREFPRLIDSRGRIPHPPRRVAGEGELVGTPISAGIVRGPVKVLHAPDEKPILWGDIMVAQATDPGWTPLFINAAGVVLEVGGLLQHGALVAREYGKPCVAGIDNVTSILRDGQVVELDGTHGVVRMV